MEFIRDIAFDKNVLQVGHEILDKENYDLFDLEKILHIGLDAYLLLLEELKTADQANSKLYEELRKIMMELQKFIQKNTQGDRRIENISRYPAENLDEALILLRYLLFFSGQYNLGRLDQYLYPYYKKDIQNYVLTKAQARNLIDQFLFFCNRRDETIIITIGGVNRFERSVYNDITQIIIEVGRSLSNLEVNVRVTSGFPQEDLKHTYLHYVKDEEILRYIGTEYEFPLTDVLNYYKSGKEVVVPQKVFPVPNIEAPYLKKNII